MSKGQILVVDDEGAQREILRTILTAEGYGVEMAGSATEALAKSAGTRFDLVLTDLRMPGADGLSLVGQLTRENPPTLVILMTAYGSMDSAEQALKQGAFDYLTKPLGREELLLTVGRAFERTRLIQENRMLRQQLHRPHHRGERDGQGADRARHSSPQPPQGSTLRGCQLRRHPRDPDRERAVRV